MIDISKQDWKLFREKLPGWQEHYMERLIKEYIDLLSAPGNASDHTGDETKRLPSLLNAARPRQAPVGGLPFAGQNIKTTLHSEGGGNFNYIVFQPFGLSRQRLHAVPRPLH